MAHLRATLLALFGALALPAGAQATLLVTHQSTAVAEQPADDGLIGPGDAITLTETLLSAEPALTGVTGRLTSSTPGVTITRGGSSFPDAASGATTANSTAYTATITPSVECGQNLSFNLDLGADQGQQDIPFVVGTGAAGPLERSDSLDVPRTLLADTTISSTLEIAQAGRVKAIRVDLGRIVHAGVGNLKIWIEAPDHTAVTLIDQRGGTGNDFIDTVFVATGDDITGGDITTAAAPFTGAFAAEGGLDALIGHSLQGTWTLHVADFGEGGPGTLLTGGGRPHRTSAAGGSADGTLNAWGLHLAAAACGGAPIPSFTATPNPVIPGGSVTFDGAASVDPNGTIADYAWDLDGDGSFETDTGTTPSASRAYPVKAAIPVGLRVTDNEGHQATTTVPLAVTRAPVALFTYLPDAPVTGETVTFDGSASSDPDGTIAGYAWDLDGNGSFERVTGSAATTTTAFATPGVHTVRLRATDDTGATNVRSVDVFVANHAPVARIAAPATITAGVPATFSASASSDPDGAIARYEWELDNSGVWADTTTQPTWSVTWPTAGTHVIRVRVSDDAGATDIAGLTIGVVAPAVSPGGSGQAPGGSGAGGSGAGGTGAGGAAAPPALRAFSAGLLGASIQAMRLARTRGITLACRVAALARCTLTAKLSARDAARLGLSRRARTARVVGRAVVVASPGKDGRFVMALSVPLRRALRRAHQVRLIVRGSAIDVAGRKVKLARSIILRR